MSSLQIKLQAKLDQLWFEIRNQALASGYALDPIGNWVGTESLSYLHRMRFEGTQRIIEVSMEFIEDLQLSRFDHAASVAVARLATQTGETVRLFNSEVPSLPSSSNAWSGAVEKIAGILRSSGRFTKVITPSIIAGREVDIEGIEEPRARVKIRWLFEIKTNTLIAANEIEAIVSKRNAIVERDDEIKFVLIHTGHLTRTGLTAAQRDSLTVWSVDDLISRFVHTDPPKPTEPKRVVEKSEAARLLTSLENIRPGREFALDYQDLVADIMRYLFVPPLQDVAVEVSDKEGRNRRDQVFENDAETGFWNRIRTAYDANYILVDAKNYMSRIGNRPIIEIAHYLKPHGLGLFGLVVARQGLDGAGYHAVREQWIGGRKMIVLITDDDLKEMIDSKNEGKAPEEILRKRIAEFRIGL